MVKGKLYKRTNLVDFNGNANEIRAIIRVSLWGIVEKIKLLDDDYHNFNDGIKTIIGGDDDNDGDHDHAIHTDLPIQFTSKKLNGYKNSNMNHLGHNSTSNSNTHKRKLNLHDKIFANEKFILPKPKLNETLLESNIVKTFLPLSSSSSVGKTQLVYVRILGVSCTLPCGLFAVARIIGFDRDDSLDGDTNVIVNDSDNPLELKYKVKDIIEVCRDRLQSLKAIELHKAHLMVKNDEAYLSSRDAPSDVHLKYWNQRYRLLSLYDHGIKLDSESWYSITPEIVSKHVTNSCLGRAKEKGICIDIVMECFSGCGGNTIPFAMKGKHVIAVDFDDIKLNNLK